MAEQQTKIDELRRILKRDGGVQASVVVKEARPKRAPLHDEFEWDDSLAGQQYRLGQARRLIRVTPYVEDTGSRSRYVHVPAERIETPTAQVEQREGIYRPIKEVVQEPSEFSRALAQLETQRRAMSRTIRELKRAAEVSGAAVDYLPQLDHAMGIVNKTLRLMLKESVELATGG